MNLHVPQRSLRPTAPATTRAAEGMARRAWTVAEVEAMVRAGIIGDEERVELIGGELVPMASKGPLHEDVKRLLNIYWARALPAGATVLTETTLRSGPIDFREPDFVFWPDAVRVADLKPADVQLIVEISHSSLDYDLGRKMRYYASLGLSDYWVIDAQRLATHIHREPRADGYVSVVSHAHTALLTPLLLPSLSVRLADLGLEPVSETP